MEEKSACGTESISVSGASVRCGGASGVNIVGRMHAESGTSTVASLLPSAYMELSKGKSMKPSHSLVPGVIGPLGGDGGLGEDGVRIRTCARGAARLLLRSFHRRKFSAFCLAVKYSLGTGLGYSLCSIS